jgi:C-terminal processing protease CtpA/Prc
VGSDVPRYYSKQQPEVQHRGITPDADIPPAEENASHIRSAPQGERQSSHNTHVSQVEHRPPTEINEI